MSYGIALVQNDTMQNNNIENDAQMWFLFLLENLIFVLSTQTWLDGFLRHLDGMFGMVSLQIQILCNTWNSPGRGGGAWAFQKTEQSSSSPAETEWPRGGHASANSEDTVGTENRHEPHMQRLVGRSLPSQTGSCWFTRAPIYLRQEVELGVFVNGF